MRARQRETREKDVDSTQGLGRGRALVAAVVLHVAIAGLVVLVPVQPRRVAAPASSNDSRPGAPDAEIAIEVAQDPVADSRENEASKSPAGSSRRDLALTPAAKAPSAATPRPTAAVSPPSESEPAAVGPAIMTSREAAPDVGLALGGQNTFVTSAARGEAANGPPAATTSPGAGPPSAAESKRRADAMLRGTGQARDRELGLGPEGPVLHALGDATMGSFAPVKGRAVFRAIADGTGMIVGIEVLSCDGGRDGWVNAAEIAREALKGKKLRLPSTATQAEMRIEIVSEMKMPSGHDPGVDVSVLGLPITKGDGPQSTQVRILDPLSLSFLAGTADPSDIGAKPRRVVRTRILDTKVL